MFGQCQQACFVALVIDAGQGDEVIHRQTLSFQAVQKQVQQLARWAIAPTTQTGNHPGSVGGVIGEAGYHERHSCQVGA